jgi:hypothetical protein
MIALTTAAFLLRLTCPISHAEEKTVPKNKETLPALRCGEVVGAVRRPKNRSQWTRGYVCAIAVNWKHHECSTATRDLLTTAGTTEHILRHADTEDIETLQAAGFLSPNVPDEPTRGASDKLNTK